MCTACRIGDDHHQQLVEDELRGDPARAVPLEPTLQLRPEVARRDRPNIRPEPARADPTRLAAEQLVHLGKAAQSYAHTTPPEEPSATR